MVEVLLYLLRVHIILKKDMTLSLTAKQLKVAQLKQKIMNLEILSSMLSIDHLTVI